MRLLALSLLAGVSLALAGCGDDDSGGGTTGGGMAQCVKSMNETFAGKGEAICKCGADGVKASSISDEDKKKLLANFTTAGVSAAAAQAYTKIMAECANKAK